MTYRLPSLNALRAFEAAARNLGFQAAARELGVTSGAVSQQVRKLEHSLGVALFRRLSNGLELTREGEIYLPRIIKIFDDLTEATEEIAPDMNGMKFTVGVCPTAIDVLPTRWPLGGRGLDPYVRARVETSRLEEVETGEVDCLVRLGSGSVRDLDALEIPTDSDMSRGAESLYLICRPSLANCSQVRAIAADLRGLFE
jgi:LysR family glycine cleavage system transcriptional activator